MKSNCQVVLWFCLSFYLCLWSVLSDQSVDLKPLKIRLVIGEDTSEHYELVNCTWQHVVQRMLSTTTNIPLVCRSLRAYNYAIIKGTDCESVADIQHIVGGEDVVELGKLLQYTKGMLLETSIKCPPELQLVYNRCRWRA